MRYSEIILERKDKNTELGGVIAAALKARAQLSTTARGAIEEWLISGWDNGPLEMAFRTNTPLAQEITRAFEPVRELMRSSYGDTVPLYRGQREFTDDRLTPGRVLFSWTSQSDVAQHFAMNQKPMPVLSDAEIARAVEQFKTRGFCKLGQYTYKLSSETPEYYLIYKGKELISDGDTDDFEADRKENQQERIDYNKEILQRGKVVSAQIPVDDIVWIDNSQNCKEFITKVNPLSL